MPVFLDSRQDDFETAFQALLGAKREDSPDVDSVVAEIIADVRARGDAAVLDLTAKFDRLELDAADVVAQRHGDSGDDYRYPAFGLMADVGGKASMDQTGNPSSRGGNGCPSSEF